MAYWADPWKRPGAGMALRERLGRAQPWERRYDEAKARHDAAEAAARREAEAEAERHAAARRKEAANTLRRQAKDEETRKSWCRTTVALRDLLEHDATLGDAVEVRFIPLDDLYGMNFLTIAHGALPATLATEAMNCMDMRNLGYNPNAVRVDGKEIPLPWQPGALHLIDKLDARQYQRIVVVE